MADSDVLLRNGDGWDLIEVKSSSSTKEYSKVDRERARVSAALGRRRKTRLR